MFHRETQATNFSKGRFKGRGENSAFASCTNRSSVQLFTRQESAGCEPYTRKEMLRSTESTRSDDLQVDGGEVLLRYRGKEVTNNG